ncbi:FtsW/RodA/SpoVE family cell cycle protein [Paenibacillus sp. Z6-24]
MSIHQSRHTQSAAECSRQFLNTVGKGIRSKAIREEIRMEMQSHLDELAASRQEEGYPEEEAMLWAIDQMGDADALNRSFRNIHKPVLNWKLLLLIGMVAAMGLLTVFSFSAGYSEADYHSAMIDFQLFFSILGMIVFIVFYFLDYRLFSRYAWHLYGFTLIAELLLFHVPSRINFEGKGWYYAVIGPVSLDCWALGIYAYLIAIAGILSRQDWSTVNWKSRSHLAVLAAMILPAGLYFAFGMTHWLTLIFYIVAVAMMYGRAGGNRRLIVALSAAFAASVGLTLFKNKQAWNRITETFSFAAPDPNYAYNRFQIMHSVRSAGWWGQGFGVRADHLPYSPSQLVFTYFAYAFGWIAAGVLLLVIAIFITRCLTTVRLITDPYGQLVFTSLAVMLIGQLLYTLGASTGVLPFTTMYMPFFSYGATATILSYAAIGMMLGIYRRKKLISVSKKVL